MTKITIGLFIGLLLGTGCTYPMLKNTLKIGKKGPKIRNSHIYYKNHNNTIIPVSKEEFSRIYPVELQYSFPTNTHQAFPQLNSEEIREMSQDNRLFLEKKINEINPDIKVGWIPTTVYEGLFYKNLAENPDVQKTGPLDYTALDMCITKKELFQEHMKYKDVSEQMNSFAVNTLGQDYNIQPQPELMPAAKACEIALDLYPYLPNYRHTMTDEGYETVVNCAEDKNILKQAVNAEYNAEKQGNYMLYRGTRGNDGPMYFGQPHSLSLGSSLFAGSRRDKDATAYNFMQNSPQAYAVTVNKEEYLNKGNVYNKVNIPALSRREALDGYGEFFHARTKTYYPPKNGIALTEHDKKKNKPVINKLAVTQESWFDRIMNYFRPNKKEQSFNMNFMKYLDTAKILFKS